MWMLPLHLHVNQKSDMILYMIDHFEKVMLKISADDKKNHEKLQSNLWCAAVVNGALRAIKVICTLYWCSAINVLLRFPIERRDLGILGPGLQNNC